MEQLQLELAEVQSRVCTKCAIEKDHREFSKQSSRKDGLNPWCKSCCKEHYKKYYDNNADYMRARSTKWAEENKERRSDTAKIYREKNALKIKERHREYHKEYYLKNRDEIKAKVRMYKELNPELKKAQDANYYYNNLEKLAKKRAEHYLRTKEHTLYINYIYREKNKYKIKDTSKKWRELNLDKWNTRSRNYRSKKKNAEGTHNKSDINKLFKEQSGICNGCNNILETSGPNKYHVDHKTPLSRGGSNWPDNLQLLCKSCNVRKNNKTQEEWDEYKRKFNLSLIDQTSE